MEESTRSQLDARDAEMRREMSEITAERDSLLAERDELATILAEQRQAAGLQSTLTELGETREQLVTEIQQAQDQRNALQEHSSESKERLSVRTDQLASLQQRYEEAQQQRSSNVSASTSGIAPGAMLGAPKRECREDGQFEMSGGNGEAQSDDAAQGADGGSGESDRAAACALDGLTFCRLE